MTKRRLDHDEQAEFVAQQFHDTYELLAPDFGYETRGESRKPWTEVPLQNRMLMIEVASTLLHSGAIECSATVEDDGGSEGSHITLAAANGDGYERR